MTVPDSGLLVFLGFVVIVSLSGVMMPGPVMAAAIIKGYKDKLAGVWIALAHGVVEFPLIALIYFGLGGFFEDRATMTIIGLAGGAMLIYMGWGMISHRKDNPKKERYLPYHPFTVGLITSLSNPYFFLWWATVGLLLISTASLFGGWAVAVFATVHWFCDLAWDSGLSYMAFRSRKLWRPRTMSWVLGFCGIVLLGFGAYFIASPLLD
jgi:threonine/homoserine/homoserine lactone efflux protein